MSNSTAASPQVAALHLSTLLAIAVMAYALANVAHEGLGHGGMCVALGGEPRVLNAVYFDCGEDGLSSAASRWISAGGTLVNLALAGLTALLLAGRIVRAPSGRYFLWLFLALNLFQAFGYWMFSGIGGIGDWQSVIAGSPHYALWRITLAVVGTAGYMFFAVPITLRGLEPFLVSGEPERLERAWRLTLPAYFAGGALYVTAGLFNPESPWLVLISAAAASFGGASALAWMTHLLSNRRRFPPTGGQPLGIAKSWPWLLAGALVAVVFITVLGPGVVLGATR